MNCDVRVAVHVVGILNSLLSSKHLVAIAATTSKIGLSEFSQGYNRAVIGSFEKVNKFGWLHPHSMGSILKEILWFQNRLRWNNS